MSFPAEQAISSPLSSRARGSGRDALRGLPRLHGSLSEGWGPSPDSVVQTIDEIMADSERLVRVWHDPSPFSMRQVALAPCSPFSVSGDLLRESAKLARTLGVRLHTHVAETRDEEQFTLEKFGLRPIAYMQSLGWTGPDVWYAHGIHFNDDELRILAETGHRRGPLSRVQYEALLRRMPGAGAAPAGHPGGGWPWMARPPTTAPVCWRKCACVICSTAPRQRRRPHRLRCAEACHRGSAGCWVGTTSAASPPERQLTSS